MPRGSIRNSWFPVTLSSEVGDKPVAATLLDTDIMLWRTAEGIAAFPDRSIHRGIRLSLGSIDGERLVCLYHGWCFNKDGTVVRIPAIPAERRIPGQIRMAMFPCTERYGLVYVCLGEPQNPIYDVPEVGQSEFVTHVVGPVHWSVGAARSLENFFDAAHLPWVHPDVLGNAENVPLIPSREVSETELGFYFECGSDCLDRVGRSKVTENLLTYDVVLPYFLYHENVTPAGDRVIDLFYCTPVSQHESLRFMLVARNFTLDTPAETFKNFTLAEWEQDHAIVESQQPAEVPADPGGEFHMHGSDGPSMVYRRMLGEMGDD